MGPGRVDIDTNGAYAALGRPAADKDPVAAQVQRYPAYNQKPG